MCSNGGTLGQGVNTFLLGEFVKKKAIEELQL